MARRTEVLTQILVANRVRNLNAQTSTEMKGETEQFTFSITPVNCKTRAIKDLDLYAKVITLAVDINLFQKDKDDAFASINIVVDGKATVVSKDEADEKLYNELLKTASISTYEFAKNKIASLLFSMDIEDFTLPAIDQKKLVSLFRKVEKENEKEEQ